MDHVAISFENRLITSHEVLLSGVQGESVLLNLASERYFGLDEIGTRMLTALTSSPSIQAAYETLLSEFEVDAEVLRRDLIILMDKLIAQGLVEIAS